MARATGLDVGNRRIKIVEVEGNPPKKIKITGYAAEDIPAGVSSSDAKELGSLVSQVFRKSGLRRELVGTALSAGSCTFREISLPFKNDDQIDKVVKFEAEGHIHYGDIDQTVVDYFKLYETAEKAHLMVLAARKRDIANRIEMFERAKVDPMFLDVDVMATFNTVSALGYTEDHACFVVVDIGEHDTKVLTIQDGILRKVRSIRMGTAALTRSSSTEDSAPASAPSSSQAEEEVFVMEGEEEDLVIEGDELLLDDESADEPDDDLGQEDLSPDEEDGTPNPYASSSPRRGITAVAPGLAQAFSERVSREIIRSLAAIVDEKPLEAVYLTGGGSLIPGIADYVQQKIGRPTQPLDILGRVEHSFALNEIDEINSGLAVGLGLALKEMGFDTSGIDLRQEDLQYSRKFDQIKVPLATVLFLFALGLFVAVLETKEPRERKAQSYRNLVETVRAHYEEANHNRSYPRNVELFRQIPGMWQKLNKLQEDYEKKLGRSSSIPTPPSVMPYLLVFFESLDRIKESIQGFTISQIDIDVLRDNAELVVKGTVKNQSHLSLIVSELQKHTGYFVEVSGGGVKADRESDDRVFNQLTCVLRVPFIEE